ncbi:MAG: TadE/TadG family type IV pilus assembly protein [Ruminiclostridium sp.]
MKKNVFLSEEGNATVLEATIIFPVVFLCVVFLIFAGFTFVQKATLQSVADRLSSYIAKCIAYPGYDEIIDPFYEPARDTGMLDRVKNAMSHSDPYRYAFGIFGLNSDVKKVSQNAKEKMLDDYIVSVSFLKPSSDSVKYPDELASLKPAVEGGYVCAIDANTSAITVYLGQNFIFGGMFSMIGMSGKTQMIYGKSTANVIDTPEMIRLVDFGFDTIEDIAGKLGIDVEKIKSFINKMTGNG